jgi:hypothetical protein
MHMAVDQPGQQGVLGIEAAFLGDAFALAQRHFGLEPGQHGAQAAIGHHQGGRHHPAFGGIEQHPRGAQHAELGGKDGQGGEGGEQRGGEAAAPPRGRGKAWGHGGNPEERKTELSLPRRGRCRGEGGPGAGAQSSSARGR